jgi:hypothetical protein
MKVTLFYSATLRCRSRFHSFHFIKLNCFSCIMVYNALMDHPSQTQYLKHSILEFLEREKMAKEQERIEAEAAANLKLQEHIYSYPDGTVYMGHMRVNDPENVKDGGLSHLRHGRGTLRTPAFVYGSMYMKNYTSEEAEENAHLAKWHEYAGTWENDKLHGYGVHIQKSGSGGEIVIFEGIWEHGKPTKRSASAAAATSSDEE